MTTFSTKRTFAASPGAIFDAFQDPDRLASWWGPAGFTNTFETFEFRAGGRWIFDMHGPDGTTYPNESTFVSIVPDREIVIRHACQPHFQLAITLEEGPDGTLLTWDQTFDDDAVARAIRAIVEPANEQNLDRLGDVLQGGVLTLS